MKKVDRSEILDLGAYEAIRDRFRQRVIAMKRDRRMQVGPHMTFIFENHDTVLMQIQEMLRTERITAEKGIAHEIDTYNDLVPAENELSATLMVEYDDKDARAAALGAMHDLGEHVHLRVGDARFTAVFQPLPGEEPDRLPTVNYMKFAVAPGTAEQLRDQGIEVALVISHPSYSQSATLNAPMRAQLADDLET